MMPAGPHHWRTKPRVVQLPHNPQRNSPPLPLTPPGMERSAPANRRSPRASLSVQDGAPQTAARGTALGLLTPPCALSAYRLMDGRHRRSTSSSRNRRAGGASSLAVRGGGGGRLCGGYPIQTSPLCLQARREGSDWAGPLHPDRAPKWLSSVSAPVQPSTLGHHM